MAGAVRYGLILAFSGTVAFSACGPLVRAASAHISSEALTLLRMALSALLVGAVVRARGGPARLPTRVEAGIALAGIVAFLHFGLFMASLYHTTVARSLALNYLCPVYTFLCESLFGTRRATAGRAACLAAALAGTLVLVSRGEPGALLARLNRGDLYALAAGMTLSMWHLLGARFSARAGPLEYAFRVYAWAAFAFLPLLLAAPARFTLVPTGELALAVAALVILPTAVGHTLVAAALAHAPAPLVSLITTQEVVLGTLLAASTLREAPSGAELAGMALSLAGLAAFYLLEARSTAPARARAACPSGEPTVSAGRS